MAGAERTGVGLDTAEPRINLIEQESERLRNYLAALPPNLWTKPSACDRWEVRDVVAHLADDAEFYREMLFRGLQGNYSPPQGSLIELSEFSVEA